MRKKTNAAVRRYLRLTQAIWQWSAAPLLISAQITPYLNGALIA